ncbi:MAG TPA: polysaccharide deacetylase family protein [Tepidisphaeraceae bacterium]|nr:polysaccharide deacetylase family protein [Tepidisphaeraceae bacterium]
MLLQLALSFDDGPHALATGYTAQVVKVLAANSVQPGIKAAFFVQTHAPARGGDPVGRQLITDASRAGHVVGIHTGSQTDHALHTVRVGAPAENVTGTADPDGENGLQSDMIRAKSRLAELTGSVPKYVRPTEGKHDRRVLATYGREGLKMVLWDVDGQDRADRTAEQVRSSLTAGVRAMFQGARASAVILLHDVQRATAAHLESYLQAMKAGASNPGDQVSFISSAADLERIFNARADG